MPRGRKSPFAHGAGGKFVTLVVQAEAEQAYKEMRKLGNETEKLKGKTKGASNAVKENTKETKKNAEQQRRLRKENNELMDSQTKSIIFYQGLTSAINQATGALYKGIAGIEAWGFANEEQARALQEQARKLELFTGALEFYLSIKTLQTAFETKDTAARTANTAATVAQTKAQWGLNAAMMANPIGMTVTVVLSLVAAMALLELKFGTITKSVSFLRKEIDDLIDSFKNLSKLGEMGIPFGGSNIVSMSKNKQYGGGLHPNPPGGF